MAREFSEEEERICPDDGKVYTLADLKRAFGTEYSEDDLHAYWEDAMCAPNSAGGAPQAGTNDASYIAVPPELVPTLWLASRTTSVVSLGTWCGVKMALRALGLVGESLPFDWLRLSMGGLLQQLREDFASFLDYSFIVDGPHSKHFVREASHSFFHDDLTNDATHAKYSRRIGRFRALRLLAAQRAATSPQRAWGGSVFTALESGDSAAERGSSEQAKPATGSSPVLLFVRALNTTLELLHAKELFDALARRFGPTGVFLLLLLDHQPADSFIYFDASPGILLRTVSTGHCRRDQYSIERRPHVLAYHEPIAAALWYVNSGTRPQPHLQVASPAALCCDDAAHNSGRIIRHVCLGEDLTTSMSYDPHMPSADTLRRASALSREPLSIERAVVVEMARSHVGFCRERGLVPQLPTTPAEDIRGILADVLAPAVETTTGALAEEWEDVD